MIHNLTTDNEAIPAEVINELPPGECLSTLVAGYAFGWRKMTKQFGPLTGVPPHPEPTQTSPLPIPRFSEDEKLIAEMVMAALKIPDLTLNLAVRGSEIESYRVWFKISGEEIMADGLTPQHALSRALVHYYVKHA